MTYESYKKQAQKIADVNAASSLLGWDQEVYMPKNGAEKRADQLATLAGIAHELATTKEFEETLKALASDKTLSKKEAKNCELSLKDFNQRKKYDTAFVELMSQTVSQCFQAWQEAKNTNNFASYEPHLQKMVELKRKECELLGYTNHPYDALLDQYEPGLTTKEVETLFEDIKSHLVDYVKRLVAKPKANNSFMFGHFSKDKQWQFGIDLLKQMGYDFDSGRQDISMHPFSTSFNSRDARVTTHINEKSLYEMIWSCIHEGGHALYEQGLPFEEYGLPVGEAISLGIHESQSRLWENNVGRSLGYWKQNFPLVQQYFSEELKGVSTEDFYKAVNIVQPGFIRINADELTYHFHIIIRFEIEKELIAGTIQAKDIPGLWNKKYKDYLGLDVTNDSMGCMQDVHWSHGSFGYFPTYSIGSFYAAQFFAQAKKEIPTLENEIEKGNMKPLLLWLREKIHCHGRYYNSKELCKEITGEPLNISYFMAYAKEKFGE